MNNEEIEKQAGDYELDCEADVYGDEVCTLPYAYSAKQLEQAYIAGAKWMQEKMEAELKMKLLTLVNKGQIIKTTVSN